MLQHSFNHATDGLNGRADDRSLLFKQEIDGAAAFELHECSVCGSTVLQHDSGPRRGRRKQGLEDPT